MIDERPGLFAPGVLETLQATFAPLPIEALDELVRLSREATQGDWLLVTDSAHSGENWTIMWVGTEEELVEITSDHLHMDEVADCESDARFIVALRNAAPALLTEVRTHRALRERIITMCNRLRAQAAPQELIDEVESVIWAWRGNANE